MNTQFYLNLKPPEFKRRFGVKIQTFQAMVNAIEQFRLEHPKDRRGRHTRLTLQEQVLVALEYWREYRTYFHIGTNWGVSESTICRIVANIESTLMFFFRSFNSRFRDIHHYDFGVARILN